MFWDLELAHNSFDCDSGRGDYALSSLSSVFASFRSAISKPSVNQLYTSASIVRAPSRLPRSARSRASDLVVHSCSAPTAGRSRSPYTQLILDLPIVARKLRKICGVSRFECFQLAQPCTTITQR